MGDRRVDCTKAPGNTGFSGRGWLTELAVIGHRDGAGSVDVFPAGTPENRPCKRRGGGAAATRARCRARRRYGSRWNRRPHALQRCRHDGVRIRREATGARTGQQRGGSL